MPSFCAQAATEVSMQTQFFFPPVHLNEVVNMQICPGTHPDYPGRNGLEHVPAHEGHDVGSIVKNCHLPQQKHDKYSLASATTRK